MLPIPQPKPIRGIPVAAPEVRNAGEADAEDIFRLATAVFGDKQFLYTVYQAPQAKFHLRRLISAEDAKAAIVVARQKNALIGYYQAVFAERDAFMSYIATDPRVESQGFGTSLLRDLEERALRHGCQRLVLDVFQSNGRAVAWYQRLGFKEESRCTLYRLNLEDVQITDDTPLIVDQEQYRRALQEEQEWGFSRIECVRAASPVQLGIIGGHTCKVLQYNGFSVRELVVSVALSFSAARTYLIVATDGHEPLSLRCVSSEVVLRLYRPLN